MFPGCCASVSWPDQRLHLTGAAALVFRASTRLQPAPAAWPGRPAGSGPQRGRPCRVLRHGSEAPARLVARASRQGVGVDETTRLCELGPCWGARRRYSLRRAGDRRRAAPQAADLSKSCLRVRRQDMLGPSWSTKRTKRDAACRAGSLRLLWESATGIQHGALANGRRRDTLIYLLEVQEDQTW